MVVSQATSTCVQAEPELFITTGSDRGIVLFDLRMSTPVRKLVMQTKSNAVAWNPIEAFVFTAASEDCNLYSFDMRQLKRATCVHQDFVSSVMDVDYSPTGREFVAGSYDRTLRIYGHMAGHSREVYHSSRMQRVFAVRFSGDGTYVYSGSDDMNLRVWKVRFLVRCVRTLEIACTCCQANASEKLGTLMHRELHRRAYNNALVDRYKHLPEVKRIVRHRHLPAPVYKVRETAQVWLLHSVTKVS